MTVFRATVPLGQSLPSYEFPVQTVVDQHTRNKWQQLGLVPSDLCTDEQFLRSMIPHHAGAILMCQEASIEDQEIRELCRSIIASQQTEIDLMKAKLDQLGR